MSQNARRVNIAEVAPMAGQAAPGEAGVRARRLLRVARSTGVTGCAYCDVFSGRASGPPVALETDELVSFIGRYQPTGPGYSLVVSRRHVSDVHALKAEELQPTLAAVQRVSRAVISAFGVSGTTIMQNNGPPGQRVMHLHFHVVPRWAGDGYPCESDAEVDLSELERQADLLRAHLRNPACP